MSEVPCTHCHTPFPPTERESEFCCSGCRFVNQLLLGEGLGDFYKFQGGQVGRPVGERPFETPPISWLESLVTTKEGDDQTQHTLRLRISGVTCVGCVWLIEKLFLEKDGAVRASTFPATAEAEFTWQHGSPTLLELARELPKYGYVLEDPASSEVRPSESRKLLPRLGLCAAFAMNTMAFSLPRYLGMDDGFAYARIFDLIALLSSTFALLIGGTYFFAKAFAAIRHRSIHIDLPIALGLALAYLGSLIGYASGETHLLYFDFVSTFTVLMLGGRYLHLAASERAQSQLQGQSAIANDTDLADGTRKRTRTIATSDLLKIPPGQALPVAGKLLSPAGEFSLAWMTGEPEPRTIPTGGSVPAGAIPLGSSPIELEATEDYADSLVSRLTRQEARHEPADSVQHILKYYLVTIILIGLSTGIGWFLAGAEPLVALQRMISVFIISCPCAIGVAIPLVDRRASSALARIGVFIQNPALWQALGKVRHLVFDKTGTLTLENPELIDPDTINRLDLPAKEALAALTSGSLHPLSRSISQHLATPRSDPPQAEAGLGVSILLDGKRWTLGKPGWRGAAKFQILDSGNLACELACDGQLLETFRFRETLRPRALQAMRRLAKSHHLHILSGDQASRVTELAQTLGIPASNAHGAMTPEEKESLVKSLGSTLYLGDGMNDTLAFAAATVSGTPVADRSLLDRRSDFLFTCPGLAFLPSLFSMAKWRRQTVGLILAFTIIYNFAAILACVLGHMTPLAAAVLMPLSSIFSLLIARRTIRSKTTQTSPTTTVPLPGVISIQQT